MAMITISRQFGSGGDEIAARVAKALGYSLFNKELIDQAAREEGFSEQEGAEIWEDNFKISGFLERLFGGARPVGFFRVWSEDELGVSHTVQYPLTEEHARFLVEKAVRMACEQGDMIILGRGGQVMLQDNPDALHVRIEAPLEMRIQRVKVDYSLERRPAQDLIEERDEASAGYIKRLYGAEWDDTGLYHLVINTGKMEMETAVQLICEAARMLLPQPVAE